MKEDDEGEELEGERATKYRALAARLNYLSLVRPTCSFSVKETCREMAKPTTGAWTRLERIWGVNQGKAQTRVRVRVA